MKKSRKVIRVGRFEPDSRIYVQECRKCGTRHESTHLLFICQNRKLHCSGTMTAPEEFFDADTGM